MTEFRRQGFRRGEERRKRGISCITERRGHDRRHRHISWIPLFRDAEATSVTVALSTCEVLEVPAGTPLLIPGQANRSVFIPLSGGVHAYLDTGENLELAISIVPGDCVGELSAIDGKPVSALVSTSSDARILKIPNHVFWEELMVIPGVARNLCAMLSERMRRTNEMALKAQKKQLELQHLKKELDVARRLQTSMIPLQRPLFPECQHIEACGFMEPAASIGGDFFDTFFVREDLLFLCIGDVSGHGIASALFMARAIGLIRVLAVSIIDPGLLMKELNDRLCDGNDADIFVTLFCGFLNIRTGDLSYSNGGHCAPMVVSRHGGRLLPLPAGPLVGAFPGISFGLMSCILTPSDTLFCYTDGVTEAQSASGEEFSEERVLRLLTQTDSLPISAILESCRDAVATFTGKWLLDDDCTMFSVRVRAI